MKYLINIIKKQIETEIITIEHVGSLKSAQDLALKLTEDKNNEEVILRIHPEYTPNKGKMSDVLEKYSQGAAALNKIFKF